MLFLVFCADELEMPLILWEFCRVPLSAKRATKKNMTTMSLMYPIMKLRLFSILDKFVGCCFDARFIYSFTINAKKVKISKILLSIE